jgi:hypothetical protein
MAYIFVTEAFMYEIPTPEEFKAYLKAHNLTGERAAAYTGVHLRSLQRWIAPAEQKGARTIPWAAWTLIRLLTGDITPKTLLKQIETEIKEEK